MEDCLEEFLKNLLFAYGDSAMNLLEFSGMISKQKYLKTFLKSFMEVLLDECLAKYPKKFLEIPYQILEKNK